MCRSMCVRRGEATEKETGHMRIWFKSGVMMEEARDENVLSIKYVLTKQKIKFRYGLVQDHTKSVQSHPVIFFFSEDLVIC